MGQGQSSSSNRHRHARDIEFEQPSPYASAIARKTPHLGAAATSSSDKGGLRRARTIRHDVNTGIGGLQQTTKHHSSSTAASTQKSSSTSTVSSTGATTTRYIPHMKTGKGLTMPRGGAPLHSGNVSSDAGANGGYGSPDSWGFHINITPTPQEVYAANAGGPSSSGLVDPRRHQNQVFKNLQNANTTNMGWTSVPI